MHIIETTFLRLINKKIQETDEDLQDTYFFRIKFDQIQGFSPKKILLFLYRDPNQNNTSSLIEE